MDVVHVVVSVATSTTDSDQFLLRDLVGDLRKLALFAANPLHDEFVEVALQVFQPVLAPYNCLAFRVGANFNTEVF